MPTPAVNSTIKFTNVANEFTLAINPPARGLGANFRFAGGTYTPASPAIPTGGTAAIRLSGDLGGRTKFVPTPPSGLYTWPVGTGYTFTASGTGANTSGTVPTGYSGRPFYPTYVVMPQAGYQYLTIGNTGTYTIRVAGAAGSPSGPGRGGAGAILQATSPLTQGQVLIICCGQVGICNLGISGGGAGGMSGVFNGATEPWIVAAGGGGAAGPGTGQPPVTFNAPNAPTTFLTEGTASANGGGTLVRGTGSGAQTSVSASAAQPTWSVGLINSSGTRLGGKGSTALAGATDGGWGGAGNGGGGAGDGGSAGGWIGGLGVAGKTPGNPGQNMIRSTLGTRQYIGANPSSPTGAAGTAATNGYVIITRNS